VIVIPPEEGLRFLVLLAETSRLKPAPARHDDLLKRRFTAATTNRVRLRDVAQHRAKTGGCIIRQLSTRIRVSSWTGRLATMWGQNSSTPQTWSVRKRKPVLTLIVRSNRAQRWWGVAPLDALKQPEVLRESEPGRERIWN